MGFWELAENGFKDIVTEVVVDTPLLTRAMVTEFGERYRESLCATEDCTQCVPRGAIAAVLDAVVAYAEAHAALYTCEPDQAEATVDAVERTGADLLALVDVEATGP